jgi:hypothetical protein
MSAFKMRPYEASRVLASAYMSRTLNVKSVYTCILCPVHPLYSRHLFVARFEFCAQLTLSYLSLCLSLLFIALSESHHIADLCKCIAYVT